MRWHVWALVFETFVRNPGVIRDVMVATVFYIYLGPLSVFVIEHRRREIAELRPRQFSHLAPRRQLSTRSRRPTAMRAQIE
jgi:hypothetical protein